MKKKILVFILLIVGLFVITGCGDKDENDNKANKKTYKIGETVETDIAKFKLLGAKYTFALNNGVGDVFATPKEYDASKDAHNPYVAAKGHTLAYIYFSIENTDRTSINLDFYRTSLEKVKYDKKEYGDLNKSRTIVKSKSLDNINWDSYSGTNLLLQAGTKTYFRAYIDVPTEVKDLEDTIEVIITLPASDGKNKEFSFVVTKEDRESYKGEEITEELAIKNLNRKPGKAYFEERLSTYAAVTGDKIKTNINGKKFNVTEIGEGGTWTGTWTFENSGKIYEGGNKYATRYVNQRTWKVEGDKLSLSWVGSTGVHTNKCDVMEVREGVYLLVENNEIFGILY